MSLNWPTFLARLQSYEPGDHLIRSPIPHSRRSLVEAQFEPLPHDLASMVDHFNGAELFIRSSPMLSLFGISEDPPLPPLEWAEDWYIDKFTPKWRNAGDGRDAQFAVGMTNYGGLMLFENGMIKEWDTAQRQWASETYPLNEWLEKIIRDGDAFFREIEGDRSRTTP